MGSPTREFLRASEDVDVPPCAYDQRVLGRTRVRNAYAAKHAWHTRHELFRGKLHFLREGTADCARRIGDDLMVGGWTFSMIQRQILKVPFGIENLALFSGDDVKLGVFLG